VNRRAFLGTMAGGLLAAPIAVEAQTPGKVYRIEFLRQGPPPRPWVEAFQEEARDGPTDSRARSPRRSPRE
jgi:hypothetical protein